MFQDTQSQTTPPQAEQAPASGQTNQQTPPPTPIEPPVKTTQEERVWSAIGYVGFLGLLTLAMMPKSSFCKKHAAHGLTAFVAWFVLMFAILFIFWPFPSIIVSLLETVAFLGFAALSVLGILRSIKSYEMNVPVFTPIAMKFPVDAIIGTIVGGTTSEAPKQPQPPQDDNSNQQPPVA